MKKKNLDAEHIFTINIGLGLSQSERRGETLTDKSFATSHWKAHNKGNIKVPVRIIYLSL